MISTDPVPIVIFSAGLLIGWGLTFITSVFINLDLRLQDLKIKTGRLTEEKAFEETHDQYNRVRTGFLLLVLLLVVMFLLSILPFLIQNFFSGPLADQNQNEVLGFGYTLIASNFSGILIGIGTGFISGIISIIITTRYASKSQRAYQINDDLRKCLDDIIENKKRLNAEALSKQFERIRLIVEEKRKLAPTKPKEAIKLWPAFEKDEYDFSYTNYFQYLRVDNIDYFLKTHAHHYPINFEFMRPKFRGMLDLLKIFIAFNAQLQNYEIELRETVNSLIEREDFDKPRYDIFIESNILKIDQYCKDVIPEIDKLYSTINPENFSEMEICVSLLNGEYYLKK